MKRMSFLKGIFAAAALVFSTSSFAHGHFYTDYYDQTMHPPADSGFFLGLNIGYVVDNWDDFESVSDLPAVMQTFKADADNLGYRCFIGYMFNKNWALELGYVMFDDVKITVTEPPAMMGDPDVVLYDEKAETRLIDFLVRIAVPLNNNFSVFTKLGFSYMQTDDAPDFKEMMISKDDRNNLAVAFGAGILYRIAKHWATDFSWMHYRGNDEIGKDYQPDLDFFSLSLALIFPT